MNLYLISWRSSEASSSIIVDYLLKKVLAHDTVDIDRYFNIINNKAVRESTKWHQRTTRPTQPISQHYWSRNSEQLPVSPRSVGEDRDVPYPQVSIRTKMRANPSKEPISRPRKIASVPGNKLTKRSPTQHTTRTSCSK